MTRRRVAVYDYTGPKGEPRIRKIRFQPKAFRMESALIQPGWVGWTFGITDRWYEWSTKALYRLPEVIAALRCGDPVWWAEGEKDADTLAGWGVCGTSTWQGASDLWPDQCRWFTRYGSRSPVKLVIDWDLPGGHFAWLRYQTLVDVGVAPERIEVVAPPWRRGRVKDVTDAAELGLSLSAVRPVGLDRVWAAASRYRAARRERYGWPAGAPTPSTKAARR